MAVKYFPKKMVVSIILFIFIINFVGPVVSANQFSTSESFINNNISLTLIPTNSSVLSGNQIKINAKIKYSSEGESLNLDYSTI